MCIKWRALTKAGLVRSKHNFRFYAIKVLNKDKIVRMKQVLHTRNEQMMLQAVQHPFIINLWGTFQDCTNLYMVMDFVPGGELFTLLRRSNVSGFTGDVRFPVRALGLRVSSVLDSLTATAIITVGRLTEPKCVGVMLTTLDPLILLLHHLVLYRQSTMDVTLITRSTEIPRPGRQILRRRSRTRSKLSTFSGHYLPGPQT